MMQQLMLVQIPNKLMLTAFVKVKMEIMQIGVLILKFALNKQLILQENVWQYVVELILLMMLPMNALVYLTQPMSMP